MPQSLLKREETSYRQDRRFLESDNYQKGYDLINHKIRVAIDLQWSLTEKRKSQFFPISFQQLKVNTQTIAIAGTDVPMFSLDDRLLYLCFHGSKHCWSSLKWICDVAELIRVHPEINWQNVEKKAKILGCSRMLWLGLFLAHDLLQTPLPAIVLEKMQADTQAYALFQKVRQLIFTRPFTQLEDYFFILQLTDSLKGKWEFISSLLFTPSVPEWKFLPLPKSVSFLYYLIRPMRLIWKYIRVAT